MAGLQRSNNDIVRRLRSLSSIENDTGNTNGGVARDQTKFDPTIGKVGSKVLMMMVGRGVGDRKGAGVSSIPQLAMRRCVLEKDTSRLFFNDNYGTVYSSRCPSQETEEDLQVKLPPVYHTRRRLHTVSINC